MLWLFKLEKKICTILCILMWLGPIVIFVGGIVMLSPDTRTIAINQYNSAVDGWTKTYRDQFALSFIDINETAETFNITANLSPDALKDKDKRFKTYVPLKYTIPLPKFIPSKNWNTVNSSIVNFRVNNSIVYTENITTMKYDVIPVCCNGPTCSECSSYGGLWDAEKRECWGTYVLTEYCIKFADNNGAWTPSREPGDGFGCGISHNWDTQTYAHINPGTANHYDYSGDFTIRSAHDPYIVAAHLTGGSLNFGLSRAEKLRIGLLICICGAIFATPVAIIFIVCCKHMAKKHRHLHGVGYSNIN